MLFSNAVNTPTINVPSAELTQHDDFSDVATQLCVGRRPAVYLRGNRCGRAMMSL